MIEMLTEPIAEAIDSNLLILWGAAFKSYDKGDFIFREDEHAHFYYQVVSGKIKMVNETDDGKDFIQGFFSEGQSFGEPPIFDGQVYPASAIAVKTSVVLRLSIPSFMQLLKENFEVHLNVTQLLAQRLRSKSFALKEISCHKPEHRILSLLDSLKKQAKTKPNRSGKVKIDYTRKQIADMCGVRVETVIRVMRHLFEKDMLTIERGKVYY